MTAPILEVRDLHVVFEADGQETVALRNVSFEIRRGESLAIVGESGSGKSTLIRALLGLLPENARIVAGSIRVGGRDASQLDEEDWRLLRGGMIGYVPQDPQSNLDPLRTVGYQVTVAARTRQRASGRERDRLAVSTLERVGISNPRARIRQYPHEFSGGMRQRVLIGGALVTDPGLILADEPTSGLDVTVQKRVLDDLERLVTDMSASLLLVTHDLAVALDRAERVLVLRAGEVVEAGRTERVFAQPEHSYTRELIGTAPELRALPGSESHASEEIPVAETQAILELDSVTKTYAARSAETPALSDVSLRLDRGRSLGLVGESGSGKSTIGRLLLRLTPPDAGSIRYEGAELAELGGRRLSEFRRSVQPVFQDPSASIDPRYTVAQAVSEPLELHRRGDRRQRTARVAEVLDEVLLPASLLRRSVRELSGGQKQRVAIARALTLEPSVLILDEAVSALDVIVQSQILELLVGLRREHELSLLFITHDLSVVRSIAQRTVVLRQGRVMEQGTTEAVFRDPQTDYTRQLLEAVPGRRRRA